MPGMCQLVQREIRHPPRFLLEIPNVRELHALHHRGITPVVPQPAGSGMIFCPRSHAGIFRRKPERHLSQFHDCCRRHHSHNLLQLQCQQLHRPRRGLSLLVQQSLADVQSPPLDHPVLPHRQLSRIGCSHSAAVQNEQRKAHQYGSHRLFPTGRGVLKQSFRMTAAD